MYANHTQPPSPTHTHRDMHILPQDNALSLVLSSLPHICLGVWAINDLLLLSPGDSWQHWAELHYSRVLLGPLCTSLSSHLEVLHVLFTPLKYPLPLCGWTHVCDDRQEKNFLCSNNLFPPPFVSTFFLHWHLAWLSSCRLSWLSSSSSWPPPSQLATLCNLAIYRVLRGRRIFQIIILPRVKVEVVALEAAGPGLQIDRFHFAVHGGLGKKLI